MASALLLVVALRRGAANGGRGTLLMAALPAGVGLAMHSYALWIALFGAMAVKLSVGNTSSLIGWVVAAFALGALAGNRLRGLAAILLVAAAVLSVGTGAGSSLATVRDVSDWQLLTHILASTIAYSLFLVAATIAGLMVLQDRQIRRAGPGGWLSMLPPLETMEHAMFRAIAIGLAVLSLAIFSGLVFVQDAMAQRLTHKLSLTILSWLVFAGLLLGRWRFGWRGKTAVKWTFWGFAILVLAYFGSRLVLEVVLGRQWG